MAGDSIFAPGLPFLLLFSFAAVSVLMWLAHMAVSPSAPDDRPYYACAATMLALHGAQRGSPSQIGRAVADFALWAALFIGFCLLGAIASYAVASDSRGFADATLQHVDRMLHFNWIAWYKMVAAHPVLQIAGRAAYQSIYVTPAILLGYFAWGAHRCAAQRFLVTFWFAALLTLLLFPLMPAVGPLAFLWHGPVPYVPESALWEPMLLPELRDHLIHQVDLGALRGLVSAPSFHTEAAILYIATAWPHRSLRLPLTALNLAMLLATPVEGTHYLADMLVGALVAGIAIAVIRGTELGICRRTTPSIT